MKLEEWLRRIDELIDLANQVTATTRTARTAGMPAYVDAELYARFRSSSLSCLKNCFGETHPYYVDFHNHTDGAAIEGYVKKGRGVLEAVRQEMKGGWFGAVRGLVSAEIFGDFLEMASYLLSENYKDAAAVMIGSVLEEHLRQLTAKPGIPALDTKGKPKKADLLNAELAKASVYSILDQKQVTAWLDLRNKAAHGEYSKYTHDQVQNMFDGVSNFMARITP